MMHVFALFVIAGSALAQPVSSSPDMGVKAAPAEKISNRAAAAEVKSLSTALGRANAAIRRGKTPEPSIQAAKAELGEVLTCEAIITEVVPGEGGTRTVHAETGIVRPVTVNTGPGESQIGDAQSCVRSARNQADRDLSKFESGWRPLASNRSVYKVTKWGGCPKKWPRISAEEYHRRRDEVISKGQGTIDAAESRLKSTRERVQAERRRLTVEAQTVRLMLSAGEEPAWVQQVKAGQRVRINLRVDDIELAKDPSGIVNPASYVGLVQASITVPPRVIAAAGSR